MSPPFVRRSDPSLLTLLKSIPYVAWLIMKACLFGLGIVAFLAAIFFAVIGLVGLIRQLPALGGMVKRWYVKRMERAGAEQAEQGRVDGCADWGVVGREDGDGHREGRSMDGETLYDDGEEVRGVV